MGCSPSKSKANAKPSNSWRCSAHYARADGLAALERATHFGAFSLAAVRRILAAQVRPRPVLDEWAQLPGEALDPRLREDTIGPRPTHDYQHLLLPKEPDETPSEENDPDPTEPA